MKRANVQGWTSGIPWSLHEKAWSVYAEKYGQLQSAQRIHERGGFTTRELDQFIPGWREEVSEIAKLRAERDEAIGLASEMKNWFSRAIDGEAGADYLNGEGRWTIDNPVSGWTDGEEIAERIAAFLSRIIQEGKSDA